MTDRRSLANLPSIHQILKHPVVAGLVDAFGLVRITHWVRCEVADCRGRLSESIPGMATPPTREELLLELAGRTMRRAERRASIRPGRVINATGVILHTGLGRAPLSARVIDGLVDAAGAANVEVDLESGERSYRGHQLTEAFELLTGCEDALLVNNNAAGTLLTLQALCRDREVIISRGEMIEIGGSFRLPDIFELSGARLREVGTTNRTRVTDYERAIGPNTAAIMHVHPSNFRVVGFTETPDVSALFELARRHNLISIDDIGSGSLVDVTQFGLPAEPTFPASIASGADVVLGSGDKLLGGPQAGVIVGRRTHLETIRQHPLARAVRVDKLTIGAMSATLQSYLFGNALTEIPTLQLLATSIDDLRRRARVIRDELSDVARLDLQIEDQTTPVGGGTLPGAEQPTHVVSLRVDGIPGKLFARRLRTGAIRVFPRLQQDRLIIDLRSILPTNDVAVVNAIRAAAAGDLPNA